MNINGETKIIGFLGSTYQTSKMYALYNATFAALHLNFVYIPLVATGAKKAADAIRHLGIHAVGVTIPYKISVAQYLDELDQKAERIGAVNAIINKNGKLTGSNTDGDGGILALKEKTPVKGKKVLLLGAGGTARAFAFAIKDNGGKLTILNRTAKRAQQLAASIHCQFDGLGKLAFHLQETDILINATSVGMTPNTNQSLVTKKLLSKRLVVLDIVSHPKETKLLKEAKEMGCQVVPADRMLLWQGILKFKIFTGVKPPVNIMEKIMKGLN